MSAPAYARNARFIAFISWVLEHETAYHRDGSVKVERDAEDPGGTTKFGIDQRSHPKIDIAALTLEGAKEIYFGEWTRWPCDELCRPCGGLLADVMINGGHPAVWLQKAFRRYVDARIAVDGFVGPKTCTAAIAAAGDRRTAEVVIEDFCAARASYFEGLPKFPRFGKGWLRRNEELRAWALARIPPAGGIEA
jgi:lysozyme family protein